MSILLLKITIDYTAATKTSSAVNDLLEDKNSPK
jgi:hypothetical protein